jgi:hypothetical protein
MARKTRTTIREVNNGFFELKNAEADKVFECLEKDGVTIPEWAKYCLIVTKKVKSTYDVGFFESEQEFYLRYSKVLVINRSPLTNYMTFSKIKNWSVFLPPTLIGLDLVTRLRNV